jgi:glycosyltransferase involved in cell wall biosynthesis
MTAHNILFITQYRDLGGGETAQLALVDALDPAQWRPHLLVPGEGQFARAWRERGWPVHIQRWRGASVYFVPALWARLPISRAIQRLIAQEGIALVHSDYHTLPMALPAAERAGIPCVWNCMGWWFRPQTWQRAFFRRPTATFALSESAKRGFLGEPPFMPPGRIQVLYPGINTQRFHPAVDGGAVRAQYGIPPAAPLVAMLARFQDVKGHDTFQAMARLVLESMPEARFLVAGENTQNAAGDAYRARILAAHQADPLLRERLIYAGFRADTERVMAAADVIVCASHFESYGMVNVEAMAAGRPVVSTNQGGPAETVLDGVTGYLVPPRDPAALAERVVRLLRDPARRAQIGAAGRARVEAHFAAAATTRLFLSVVEPLLTPPDQPGFAG